MYFNFINSIDIQLWSLWNKSPNFHGLFFCYYCFSNEIDKFRLLCSSFDKISSIRSRNDSTFAYVFLLLDPLRMIFYVSSVVFFCHKTTEVLRVIWQKEKKIYSRDMKKKTHRREKGSRYMHKKRRLIKIVYVMVRPFSFIYQTKTDIIPIIELSLDFSYTTRMHTKFRLRIEWVTKKHTQRIC